MNSSPEPDPDFESLLRHRASRLAVPEPAWRGEILEAIQNQQTVAAPRAPRSLWLTRWFPSSLAACWLAILLLNWSAEKETKRFSQYANAQAASVVFGSRSGAGILAVASAR